MKEGTETVMENGHPVHVTDQSFPAEVEQAKGLTLVDFWATWCGPCRDEMPAIEQLKKKLKGRPFVVLAVNVNEPESRVRKFLSRLPLDFPVLLDVEGSTTRAWKVRILPSSFLIARDGRIRYVATGELDWAHEQVADLVSELLP